VGPIRGVRLTQTPAKAAYDLHRLEGHTIRCEGDVRDATLVLRSWRKVLKRVHSKEE